MWISRYVCLFMIYSFMGWVYETIFCTIKGGRWENRGFLYGPVCPIYGTGAVIVSVIIEETIGKGIAISAWQIFIISVIGSAVLEYVTSWGLEKLFHATWWDYSKLPLNLHGRISLFTSLGFGLAGMLIFYVIAPFTDNILGHITSIMIEFFALCFVFIFAVDLTLTVSALMHFDRLVVRMEDNFNRRMEAIVDVTVQQTNQIKENVIEKRHSINEQITSLNKFTKSTVRRIHVFKDRNEQRNSIKNTIHSRLRNVVNQNSRADDKA